MNLTGPLEPLATGRERSLFAEDMAARAADLRAAFAGARVCVIGAAGSVGASVVRSLLPFHLSALTLIDLNENGLVELVRDLRSGPPLAVPNDFQSLPIGLGSPECARFFRESSPFDFILNLCALKHVRSEKNVYSLMRMIDTNVLLPCELLASLAAAPRNFFSVSSDKATRPASLMGASKMAMEMALLAQDRSFSTARFANVAFSAGSLPWGFLRRIEKRQVIAAPRNIRRFFMSHEEAGQICALSCALGAPRDCFFPKLEAGRHETTFVEIAVRLLERMGYQAVECGSEEEARGRAAELIARGQWPCCFLDADTSGEKPFEEFYGADETIDCESFTAIGIVKRPAPPPGVRRATQDFLSFARAARHGARVSKEDYVEALRRLVPEFDHIETGRSLDDKM